MSWQDRLQPVTFRGVPFYWVGDATGTSGRRGPLHEFPLRDDPLPEDLGRSARKLTLYGVTIGSSYDIDGDALIAACEAFGPGTLVHPTRGSMQMRVPDGGCQWRDSTRQMGARFFTIAFEEAGTSTAQTVTAIPGAAVSTAADTAIVAVTAAAGGSTGAAPRGDQ